MVLGLSSPLAHKSAEEWAKRHKELGCGAVVFPVSCDEPEEKIDEYVRWAKKEGLDIAEVGIWRNALAPDEEERKKALDYSVRQLKMADRIGARCCVNIVGTSFGPIWDGAYAGNYSEEAWKQAVESIKYIIDKAEPKNTKFSIEPMPWMIPTSPEEYLKLIDAVDRDAFGVHMDMVNMINCPERYFFNTEFIEKCFTMLGDRICSCHIKDVLLREEFTFQLKECACGEGTLNLEKYAELATKADERMPMIIEHLNSDEDYLNSLKYTKERLKNYDYVNGKKILA
ncbi:MAG: sugar phosphate isomerase/epimerase [Lachnospiraceae bacterium]|nr:sugar phosphate isomerase/epimerase [Lachnospiraceae bacterium]